MIFPSKTNNVVERQLDHLDRFKHEKSSQGFDNEIPHVKGGISILDQFVEEISPSNEALATYDILSHVIEENWETKS